MSFRRNRRRKNTHKPLPNFDYYSILMSDIQFNKKNSPSQYSKNESVNIVVKPISQSVQNIPIWNFGLEFNILV